MQIWAKYTFSLVAIIALIFAVKPVVAQLPDSQPGQLSIETVINLGVKMGDATTPRKLTTTEDSRTLFVLSEGQPEQGNTISAFDVEKGEFVENVRINTGKNEPLDLQFDPESGLIYALWRDRYAGARPVLTVVNSKSMTLEQEIPEIEAFTVAGGVLYTANAEEVAAVNLSNNTIDQAERVPLATATKTGPMAISPVSNHIYLARSVDGAAWALDILDANTFALLNSYPAEGQILKILPHPTEDEIFLVTGQNNFRVLYRLTGDGELADLPYELGPYSGAAATTLSPDGATIFYSNGLFSPTSPDDPSSGPALIGLDSQTFIETHNIPLLTNVEDVAIGVDNLAFAVYPFEHILYQVDFTRQTFNIANTLVRLRDAVVDSEAGVLYLSDTANTIWQLDIDTLDVLAELRLESNWADYGFKKSDYSGQLELDQTRDRLYVSGLPAVALDTQSLTEIGVIQPGGQVAADPNRDVLYVSNCGTSLVEADSLSVSAIVSGTTQRPDGLIPNPCVISSRLDSQNQWLYTIFTNGVPGSNGGSYLVVYDTATAITSPTVIYTDTTISVAGVETDPNNQRAFASNIRNSNRRVRLLNTAEKSYSGQLLGVWGTILYSPDSNRLMVGDRELKRVLALDADTLSIVDELALPQTDDYRLLALDPATDRLFLANATGQLLVVTSAAEATTAVVPQPTQPAMPADGPILSIVATGGAVETPPIYSRISAKTGDFATEPRLYTTATDETWTNVGKNLAPHPVQAIAVSPGFETDQTIFVSLLQPGQSGSLYRSTDGGQDWQPVMNGLQDLWVERIFIAPDFADTGLVVVQTTYGGIHVSTNGGSSWEALARLDPNAPFPVSNSGFAAALTAGTTLVSQAMEQMRGLYLAIGLQQNSWQQVFDVPATQLGLSPDGTTALAYGTALWRSANGGNSWEQVGQGLGGIENLKAGPIIFSPSFNTDTTVYFFFGGDTSSSGILFRSVDRGLSWQAWQPPDSSRQYTAVTMTPAGDFLLGDATAQLTRIAPTGIKWQQSSLPETLFPLDDINITADGTLFAVNRQYGLFKSTNGGRGWQLTDFPARSSGFTLIPYRIAASPAYRTDETLYVTTGQSLFRSTDGGDSWQALAKDDTGSSFPAQQVALSPDFAADQSLLVSTPLTVYHSSDSGNSWQPVLTAENDSSSTDVLILAPDVQTAFARFGYGGSLYRSNDSGQNWQAQPSGQDEFFSIISAVASAGGTLNAAVEYDRKLLQSPPWQNISASLPEELSSLTTLAYHNNMLFAAGQGGIFTSDDNGQSWLPVPLAGLPDSPAVTDMSVSDAAVMLTLSDGRIFSLPAGESRWVDVSILK
jgi:photosystem II stability/assembly factor-like uncharacterized protein